MGPTLRMYFTLPHPSCIDHLGFLDIYSQLYQSVLELVNVRFELCVIKSSAEPSKNVVVNFKPNQPPTVIKVSNQQYRHSLAYCRSARKSTTTRSEAVPFITEKYVLTYGQIWLYVRVYFSVCFQSLFGTQN